ncbi:MAG: hypothetical protein ACREUX_14865 [Burkholderiales bacterium]
MPTSCKQWGVCSKASFILAIAAAIWLVWYCAAIAASGSSADAPRVQQDRALVERTGLEGSEALVAARDPVRARFEQLSEREMKLFYTRCSREGISRRLDGGEAMACSIGYDVLLRKHFAGDFERLLAWSRSRRAAESQ